MNEQQAKKAGLLFTGHYYFNNEKTIAKAAVKAAAKAIRKLGFKAKIVTVHANSFSRIQNTGITGWSVYASKEYLAYRSRLKCC